jgi:hypothetical protein
MNEWMNEWIKINKERKKGKRQKNWNK